MKKRSDAEVQQLQARSNQWRRKGGADAKVEGFEMGYHYEYAKVAIADVVEVYKNELKVD